MQLTKILKKIESFPDETITVKEKQSLINNKLQIHRFQLILMLIRIRDPHWKKMDPHIFADPDPGSKNLADPTDPDPKHCFKLFIFIYTFLV